MYTPVQGSREGSVRMHRQGSCRKGTGQRTWRKRSHLFISLFEWRDVETVFLRNEQEGLRCFQGWAQILTKGSL